MVQQDCSQWKYVSERDIMHPLGGLAHTDTHRRVACQSSQERATVVSPLLTQHLRVCACYLTEHRNN